jgi:DNA-binding transcriptional LysR family regulator
VNVTIRHLRAFMTIARLGSFAQAARALHVTPSALSNAMRELESTLGFRLLDRTTRTVRLSEAGEQYFPYAERVVSALQEAERCASNLKSHDRGVVRIATSRMVGWALMAPVLARFHRLYPGVRVMPIDVLIEDLRGTVQAGKADMAISNTTDFSGTDTMDVVPLFRSRLHAVCSPDHRLAGRAGVHWKELTSEPLIVVGRHPLLHLKLELGSFFDPVDVHEVGDTTTALGLVAAGIGVAICPGFVRPATAIHSLSMIPCEGPSVMREYRLFTHRERTALPAAVEHKRFLTEHFAQAQGRCIEETELVTRP